MIENRCGAEPLDADAPLIPIVVDGVLDKFSVTLDPNLDGLTGYNFGVSAANVQSDIYLYNDDKMDMAWAAVWSSAVNVDADEGDLAMVDPPQLAIVLEGIPYRMVRAADLGGQSHEQAGSNLSAWLLLLMVGLMVGEQWLAYSASYHASARGGPR